jgi:hypothetical protein
MADSQVLNLHNSLRKAKDQWAVFLGAGASYDYGIPTMSEIAEILNKLIQDKKPKYGITMPILKLLEILCPKFEGTQSKWDIEDLLTRLYQIRDASKNTNSKFTKVKTFVGDSEIMDTSINQASEELITFMAKMCDLSISEKKKSWYW